MEDFVVDQARYFARILAANAKHMEEKHVVLKVRSEKLASGMTAPICATP